MIIEKIELKNYRNYENLELALCDGTNILYGDNAQGKTNVLESIYLCATTKSHRGSKDKEIIKYDEEDAHIKVNIKKREFSYRIDMHLKKNKSKGIAVNGVPIKKASELFGILNVIFFSPEDLSIIKNGPVERRRFMDLELCQIDKIYVSNLISYNKLLAQRNKILKEYDFVKNPEEILDVLDDQIVIYGERIIKSRDRFITELNNIVKDIHHKITGGKENIRIVYSKNTDEEFYRNKIKNNRENDIRHRVTTVGPHRDDIIFYNGNENIRTFGSQGQQRTAALSLKLAEIELVKKKINDTPILLLDDVLSELDANRQNQLIDSLNNIQTVITCTGVDEFIKNRLSINKIFKVTNGEIEERSYNE